MKSKNIINLKLKETIMALETIEIYGINLDVYFKHEIEKDPYGTGDSPTHHNIELVAIELATDTVNIIPLLCESVIEKIENEIFDIVTGA
jgi:hypothetical protein